MKTKFKIHLTSFLALAAALLLWPITVKAEDYGLWVGDEQFSTEKTEIKDAAGTGTATYDPVSHTLTFDNFKGVKSLYKISGESFQIYSDMEDTLVIKGDALLTSDTADYGIHTYDDLILEGNLTVKADTGIYSAGYDLIFRGKYTAKDLKGYAIYNGYGLVKVEEGADLNIGCINDAEDETLYCETLVINGGKVHAEGSGPRVYAFKVTGNVTINDGSVEAVTSGDETKAIYSGEGDIVINGGKVTATAGGIESCAIDSNGNVEINGGEVTATAGGKSSCAIYANKSVEINDVVVTATAKGENSIAIYSDDDVEINGGEVTATAKGERSYAIYSDDNVEINGGKVTATAEEKSSYAIYACDDYVRINDSEVTATADGENACAIYAPCDVVLKGGKVAATAEGDNSKAIYTSCDVVLNDSEVTATVKGAKSYAIYGADNVEIYDGEVTAEATGDESIAICGYYVVINGGKVVAKADGNNDGAIAVRSDEYVFISYGSLEATLTGNANNSDYAVYGNYGVYVYGGTLSVNSNMGGVYSGGFFYTEGGNVTITDNGSYGICADGAYFAGGIVSVKGAEYGIYVTPDAASDKILFAAGSVTAQGGKGAVYASGSDRITVEEGVTITSAEDKGPKVVSSISPTCTQIMNADETKVIKNATVKADSDANERYSIWVGDTQITGKNKTKIPSVTGGSASYDPGSNTLTFEGDVTGIKGTHNDYLIYSDRALTIQGKADLVSEESGVYGIYCDQNLRIDGELSVETDGTALYANRGLVITGSVSAKSGTDTAVHINYGKTDISGSLTATTMGDEADGFYASEGSVEISGSLTASATASNSCGFYAYEGSVEISGSLTASATASDSYGFYADDGSVVISGDVEVRGNMSGLYVDDERLTVTGSLRAESEAGRAVYVYKDILFDGGNISAKSADSYGIYSDDCNIRILSGSVEAEGKEKAILADDWLIISDDCRITLPEDGRLSDDGNEIVSKDGKAAAHIKIEPVSMVTVSFDTGNPAGAPEKQIIAKGAKAKKPSDPVSECRVLEGWFKDAGYKEPFRFSTPVREDVTLYAKWKSAHTLKEVPAKEAGIGTAGNTAYYVCSVCGRWFSDAAGEKEITDHQSVVIPAKQAPAKDPGKDTSRDPKKGDTLQDASSKGTYVVTSVGDALTVTYVGSSVKNVSTASVPDEITVNGKKYKVTEIAANAFKNNKKLKKITIGKNIKKIGKNAFFGCKNLKKITIKTVLLKKKTVGANAFKKIHPKARVKVPKKKLKDYKKTLKARGIKGKGQKIK